MKKLLAVIAVCVTAWSVVTTAAGPQVRSQASRLILSPTSEFQ